MYGLVGFGHALIYRLTGIVNFAFGDLVGLAVFTTLLFAVGTGPVTESTAASGRFLVAAVLGVGCCALASGLGYVWVVQPFLARHCLDCHGAKKPKGDLRLDQLRPDFADAAALERWLAVLKRVKAGEMPPKSRPRPPAGEVQALADWIHTEAVAAAEGLSFNTTLRAAIARRPNPESQTTLPSHPRDMRLLEFQALPPNYLDTLLRLYAREERRRLGGQPFTSRVEATHGRLILALRQEHLIAQLADSEQPKIILDATAQPALLQSMMPGQPIRPLSPGCSRTAAMLAALRRFGSIRSVIPGR